jgi:hypothetical protein
MDHLSRAIRRLNAAGEHRGWRLLVVVGQAFSRDFIVDFDRVARLRRAIG